MRKLQRYTSPDTGISHYCNNEYLIKWDGMKIVILNRPTQEEQHVLVYDEGDIEVFAYRKFTGEQFKTELENEVIKQACLDMAVEIVNYFEK